MRRVFGTDTDPIEAVEERARKAFPNDRIIVWEGNPATFAFTYVGGDAIEILGFEPSDWTGQADFWTSRVVHSGDREAAVAFCAMATARGCDHVFEYRALSKSYDIRWLKDYVNVVLGARRIPTRLRGIMFDITDQRLGNSDPIDFHPREGVAA